MATKRTRRGHLAHGRLSEDQEAHLCDGWSVDPCRPFHGTPGFPFRNPEHRREVWEANKAYLAAKYAGHDFAAAGDYDGAEVDAERTPNVWGRIAGSVSAPHLADILHLEETRTDDGD